MSEISLLPAWQRNDPKIAAEAIAFWQRLGALPAKVKTEDRVKQLCVAAYSGDSLVGVSTIAVARIEAVRARFGLFRCLVDPQYRRGEVARKLAMESRDVLSAWSRDNPSQQVMGMASIIESPALSEFSKSPIWPASGLTLIGYTQNGRQVRVVWFDHARLD